MSDSFRFFNVTVRAIKDVTPGFRRYTFSGPDLQWFGDPGFDQRIKLLFPLEHLGYDACPQGANWYAQWRELPTENRHPIRTYTTRYVRPALQELDVDVVVHEPMGPASRWINEAAIGDQMLILGPNSEYDGVAGGVDFIPPEQTERFLIAGDETAAPAISVIIEQLPPAARGVVIVEVPSEADAAYLPRHAGIEVRAVSRGDRAQGEALVEATREAAAEIAPVGVPHEVEEIDIDQDLLWEVPRHAKGGAALKSTTLYAWLAGEASAVKTLRRHLVTERGLDRRAVAFMGYWREGRAEMN